MRHVIANLPPNCRCRSIRFCTRSSPTLFLLILTLVPMHMSKVHAGHRFCPLIPSNPAQWYWQVLKFMCCTYLGVFTVTRANYLYIILLTTSLYYSPVVDDMMLAVNLSLLSVVSLYEEILSNGLSEGRFGSLQLLRFNCNSELWHARTNNPTDILSKALRRFHPWASSPCCFYPYAIMNVDWSLRANFTCAAALMHCLVLAHTHILFFVQPCL